MGQLGLVGLGFTSVSFSVIRYMLSPFHPSVTLVHPTQTVKVFGNISAAFGTLAIR